MAQHTQDDPDRTELLATRAPAAAAAAGETLAPGAQLGHYRIEALLGRGGMGDVYRAQQLEPVRRTVALKLLRGQQLDARRVAYFEVERQLLARMRHPAIAQIYDAGATADGHPYFAMEFIAGSPITTYCDQHALSLRERIALFVRVCEGVQHAHQKGVIHRDLKPGNLLVDEVDGRPLPKIIDFGIATATSPGPGGEVAGTPDYMSPEQAGGDQALVDTRSDVYALGVVLCELLTGQRPNAHGETAASGAHTLRLPSAQLSTLSPADAGRIAQARREPLPRMRRVLRNELDWVVAKAMRFERGERYPSAAALAEDLQRFLDGQPLQAAPHGRGYVWRKFAQRHRTGILAASLVALALVGGLALSVYGLLQARAQRAIAEQRNAQLERVAAFQQSMLEGIDIEAMGIDIGRDLRSQVARQAGGDTSAFERGLAQASTPDLARSVIDGSILANAERAIGRDFAKDPALAADLRESVARVRMALGLPAEAAAGFAQVADYRARALGASAPQTLKARQAQVRALLEAARTKEGLALAETALRDAASLPTDDPLRIKLRLDQADAIAALGDRPRARALLEALRADAIGLRGERDAAATEVTNSLATLLGRMGEPEAGRKLLETVVAIRAATLGKDHADTLSAQHNLAIMRIMTGDKAGAVAMQRELAAIQTRRLGAAHPSTLGELGNLANMLSDSGDNAQALPIAQAVVEARTRVMGADHPQTLRGLLNLSTVYARSGDFARAIPLQEQVADARMRMLGPSHPDTMVIQLNRAATLYQAGRAQDALAQLARYLANARQVLGERHRELLMGYIIRAQAADELGQSELAIASYREFLALADVALGHEDARTVDAAWQLEGLLRTRGQAGAADELRARYIEPLLRADPKTLDEARLATRQNIIDTEREKARQALR
ncbi:serine/threonine-protein kinase [Thermomonas sp. LB-4]|uniref:serine/threonine-protein kinase n=1 Tax=Thermomonas sp. LB-4 TaxID=3102790 RepID=UPI002EDA929D